MGYISNQWINKGQGLRNRKYSPVPVAVTVFAPADTWSLGRNVRIELRARQVNGQYQTLHLTGDETEAAAEAVVMGCGEEKRKDLLQKFMKGLSDAELLEVLATDLRKRKGTARSGQ